jgi:hypothetical protein
MKRGAKNGERHVSRFVYWTPRILSILLILFLALFSLDVFESASNTQEALLRLLMHNIPALILTGALIISWRHEIVGAVAFIFVGLLYIIITAINLSETPEWYLIFPWSLMISGPAFLIGILFYLNWSKKRKPNPKN